MGLCPSPPMYLSPRGPRRPLGTQGPFKHAPWEATLGFLIQQDFWALTRLSLGLQAPLCHHTRLSSPGKRLCPRSPPHLSQAGPQRYHECPEGPSLAVSLGDPA